LGEDTWYYSKRCFLSLVETLAKHMIILKDSTYTEILQFLDSAEEFGKSIQMVILKNFEWEKLISNIGCGTITKSRRKKQRII